MTDISKSITKNKGGSGTKPKKLPINVNGKIMPTITIDSVAKTRILLGRLSIKGILLVLITYMTSIWVVKDSTNQPVWNKEGVA